MTAQFPVPSIHVTVPGSMLSLASDYAPGFDAQQDEAVRKEIQAFRLLIADLREDARWVECDSFSERLNRAADYMERHPPHPYLEVEQGERTWPSSL